jgi:hypothetical protein
MGEDNKKEKQTLKQELETAIETKDEDGITSTLRKVFMNVIELKITTTVTQKAPEKIHTNINLLEGDISTTIHAKFAPDPEAVANFHKDQVNKAEQIIEKNVDTLITLTKALSDLF